MPEQTTRERCHAITEDGERCRRPAGEDGFCHQHDESDETVDEYDAEAGDGDEDVAAASDEQGREAVSDGGAAAEMEGEREGDHDGDDDGTESGADEGESGDDEADSSADEADTGTDDGGGRSAGGEDGLSGVREVREAVQSLAPEVIGRELDAVIEVDGRDDGWLAVVEIVERPAVPDSQDILGRYEIDLADGEVTGYRRLDRYRRSDMDAVEPR